MVSANSQQHREQNREFNRLYNNIGSVDKPDSNSRYDLSVSELLRRKLREGNLVPETFISLANFLLNDGNSSVSRDRALMGMYCLQKAYEIAPYNATVLDNLMQLKKLLGDTADSAQLKSRKDYLGKNTGANGKLKIGIKYLAKNNSEKAERYLSLTKMNDFLDIESLFTLADLYLTGGSFYEADALFSRLEPLYAPENPFYCYFWNKYGQLEIARNDLDKAAWCLDKSVAANGPLYTLNNLAEVKLRAGERNAALALWAASLKADPLQIPLYLKMHDIAGGLDTVCEENLEAHNINILVYTFNKHDMFKRTIEGLADTDIGNARILLLDNHCTDGTREFLQTARQLFPNNSVKVINLPVNIGAPAARNWLLAQPENDGTDFVAYLDDDVILPRDWLKRLVGTLKAFPDAAIAGGKIINQGIPKTIQYIYRFFDVIHETRLILSSKHPDEIDLGQFDFTRKCLSVMGCCHLLRTDIARDVGEFDIRFSPSQVDDIDHDIMTCMKGHEIIYNGYLEITHCQKAGKEALMSRPALGNILGNDCKFAMKHSADDINRLKLTTEDIDRQDIRRKIQDLQQKGLLTASQEVPFDII
ncbi:glycosyltransferase [Thermodesulfobacteriota bacterium]